MRMQFNPDAGQGGSASEDNAENSSPSKHQFDPEQFKNDIIESNKQFMQQLQGTVESTVRGMMDGIKAVQKDQPRETPHSNFESNEFASEMEVLGVEDPKQIDALISIMEKRMRKNAPQFKEEVIGEVNNNLTYKEQKQAYENEVMMKYPEVTDKNSQLYKTASQIWASMSEDRQTAPDAMSNAVLLAASRLGIPPLTIEQIKQKDAQNSSGNPQSIKAKSDDISDKQRAFSEAFGVKPEHFKKKLSIVKQKLQY